MQELDSWVTEYEGIVCSSTEYHIYKCVEDTLFDESTIYVGAQLTVDDQIYKVCGLDVTHAGPVNETWHLVYAHLVPQSMTTQEWHELYGN